MRRQFLVPINLALIAILGALPIVLTGDGDARAHHKNNYNIAGHVASLRSIPWHETYCVEDLNTTLDFNTALNRVRDTLIVNRTDVNWDLKQGGYTDFRTTWVPCRNLNSGTTPRRTDVEIEYHVIDTITSPGWCEGTSCAWGWGVTWNGPHGRTEWQYWKVQLRGQLIKNGGSSTTHVVNHETGHVLGLADGGPTSKSWDTSCPSSIMHPQYYGCSVTLDWPNLSTDHISVNQIIAGQP